jgi:hypothetical protein
MDVDSNNDPHLPTFVVEYKIARVSNPDINPNFFQLYIFLGGRF